MVGWMFLFGLIAGFVAVVIIDRASEVSGAVEVTVRARSFVPPHVYEAAQDAI